MIPRSFLLGLVLVAMAAPPAPAEPRRWTPVPGKSEVTFDVRFPMGDFSGRSEQVGGEIEADPADLRTAVTGRVLVQAATLRTGLDGRDRDMWKALEVERHPEIRFAVASVEPSFPSVTDHSDVLLTIKGAMLIHGVERPMTVLGRVRVRDGRLWVRGESRIRMTDFGIAPPKRLFLAVTDDVALRFDLTLAPR